jgi:molybdopterin-guanine dinucleotide biosynthesis protein A
MTDNGAELIAALTGVVLAGGENRRFPFLKGFIPVGEGTIMDRSLQLMSGIFARLLVSTNTPERYFPFGVPMVGDILKSGGPMSGLHASLIQAGAEGIFVLACDMPFVKPELIRFICWRHENASRHEEWDATIPVCHGRPQPLMGIYRRSLIPRLEEGIIQGKGALRRFLGEIKADLIPEEDLRRIDADGLSFVNINTVEDYERVMGSGLTLTQ